MFDNYSFNGLPGFTPVNPKSAKTARVLNTYQCADIFNRLCNAALSRFKWINLPDSCNERALEMTIFFYGWALFFRDEDLGFIHTPCNLTGPFNVYYESIVREAYSFEYRKRYDITNSVVVRGNKLMTPDYMIVWNYAPKIADGMRAADVHAQTLKSPFGIATTEQNKKSVLAALKKIDDNEIGIFWSKDYINKSPFEVMNFVSNCWLPEMWNNVKNYLEQCYTSLGIESMYSSKKERLVAAESEGQINPTRHIIESELACRKQACTEINRMFGLNVDVELNQIDTFIDENLWRNGINPDALDEGEGEGDVNV